MVKLWSAGLAVALVACSDSAGPRSDFLGAYTATSISVSTIAGGIDLKAGGAHLSFWLHSSGRVSGHLVLPGHGPEGSTLDQWFEARWHVIDDTIWFEDVPVFLRDAIFTAQPDASLLALFGPVDGTVRIVMSPTIAVS